jgi:hypothetical protein
MEKILVFNQEIENCYQCPFYSRSEKECYFSEVDTFEYQIPTNCPFAKPLTKEDLESFGFEQSENNLYAEREYKTYRFRIYTQDVPLFVIKIFNDFENKFETLFKGFITSKPHLEFILKSLNII